MSADEYRATETLAKNFSSAGSIGEKLQKLLEDRAAKSENWVNLNPNKFWFLNLYIYIIYQIVTTIFFFSFLIGG